MFSDFRDNQILKEVITSRNILYQCITRAKYYLPTTNSQERRGADYSLQSVGSLAVTMLGTKAAGIENRLLSSEIFKSLLII